MSGPPSLEGFGAPAGVVAAIDRLREELAGAAGANLAGLILYGGLARGRYRPGRSDVNLIVLLHDAIVGLVQRRVLAVAPAERKLIAQSPLPAQAHPLEKAVAPSKAKPERTVVAARSAARPALAEIRDRLIGLGLVVADGQAWATRLVSSAPLLAVLALGILKFIVGMTRHRPVGFLFWLCALSYGIAVILLCVRPHRSRYGDRVLDRIRRENEALGTATESRADELTGADLALAWALFGTAILAAGPLADLRTALLPPAGSSGDGGGGCGGGCGGCGG